VLHLFKRELGAAREGSEVRPPTSA